MSCDALVVKIELKLKGPYMATSKEGTKSLLYKIKHILISMGLLNYFNFAK